MYVIAGLNWRYFRNSDKARNLTVQEESMLARAAFHHQNELENLCRIYVWTLTRFKPCWSFDYSPTRMKFVKKKEIYQAELHTICCRFCGTAALLSEHKGLSKGGAERPGQVPDCSQTWQVHPHVMQTEKGVSFPQISARGPLLHEATPVQEIRPAHYISILWYRCPQDEGMIDERINPRLLQTCT